MILSGVCVRKSLLLSVRMVGRNELEWRKEIQPEHEIKDSHVGAPITGLKVLLYPLSHNLGSSG